MTPFRTDLSRLFPAAALVAALGLPLTACAQDQAVQDKPGQDKATVVSQNDDPKAKQKIVKDVKPKAEEKKEKTAEELKKEAEEKEIEQIQHEAKLRAARLSAELAPLKEEKQRIEAEIAHLQAKQQDAHAKATLEKEQADFLASLRLAEMNREMMAMQAQMQAMQTKIQIDGLKQQAETADLTAANAKLAAQASALQAELALIQTQRSAASIDKDPMKYPTQPLKDGVLTISDRRIPLNGGVTRGTADFVTERIHYYNNLNEKAPIFIVIDSNPGGLVMEGFRIVTAMQNSKAPVHVVVKSYAASMAAVITTLAEESYCYPNAIILHHQMSSGMRGNLTQQKEQLEEGFEWAKRLADPVAEKMGVSYDELTELMYKNNSDGDWAEFGDKAVKLKWVNNVVEEIRETALTSAPVDQRAPMFFFEADNPEQAKTQAAKTPRAFTQHELFNSPTAFELKTDGNGKTYYELPPLRPYDYYFLHDPEGRYRLAK